MTRGRKMQEKQRQGSHLGAVTRLQGSGYAVDQRLGFLQGKERENNFDRAPPAG